MEKSCNDKNASKGLDVSRNLLYVTTSSSVASDSDDDSGIAPSLETGKSTGEESGSEETDCCAGISRQGELARWSWGARRAGRAFDEDDLVAGEIGPSPQLDLVTTPFLPRKSLEGPKENFRRFSTACAPILSEIPQVVVTSHEEEEAAANMLRRPSGKVASTDIDGLKGITAHKTKM